MIKTHDHAVNFRKYVFHTMVMPWTKNIMPRNTAKMVIFFPSNFKEYGEIKLETHGFQTRNGCKNASEVEKGSFA